MVISIKSSRRTSTLRRSGFTISKRSTIKIICFAIPVLVLIGAYLHMTIQYDKIWLFNTVVHENGKYTLLEVIFYFRHFLWEFPIKTVYAFMIVGIFYYYGSPISTGLNTENSLISNHKIIMSASVFLSIVIFSFVVTANQLGFHETLLEVAQFRRSELHPLLFGAHWRNHFLSNIAMYTTSISMVVFYRFIIGDNLGKRRYFSLLLPITAIFFILMTLFFGINTDPFTIHSYLGHQLREIFGTDLSITMPLMIGILVHLESKYDSGIRQTQGNNPKERQKAIRRIICWLIPTVVIAGFLILKVLTFNISREISRLGSTEGWSITDLFAWHFFEHSLDYIYTCSLVYFLYLFTLKIDLKRRQSLSTT